MSQINLYTVTVPVFRKSLSNLLLILDKAYAHTATKANKWLDANHQFEALLQDRLIFDQFTLIRQIQIACDNAKGSIGRLAQIEVPKFEDNEKTYQEIKTRIENTIKILDQVTPEQMVNNEENKITLPFYPDQYLTAAEYVNEFLMANFFFHLSTAYAIIRKNGIEIGKSDFIGQLPLKNL